jgi:hypothetical protein
MTSPPGAPAPHDEGPPFFATWGRLYAAVLVYLALLIGLFYLFQILFT